MSSNKQQPQHTLEGPTYKIVLQVDERNWLLTSILCRRVISKRAKLFNTFKTPVATSSKFDGRA